MYPRDPPCFCSHLITPSPAQPFTIKCCLGYQRGFKELGGEQQEARDGGGIVGAHIIATYKIRDQHQLDRNYKLPSCKQQPACGAAPPSVTVSKPKMFSCCIFCFYLFQLCRDRCYFRISHSNSNSLLSGLDFLRLTSPKMPPRCLFTQLHGESQVLPPSLTGTEMRI